MKVASLSVFFPAFNEEANIQEAIEQAAHVLPSVAERYEIIVIDDGSADRTAHIVTSLSSVHPTLRLVRHGRNRGYGAALKSGFAAARYDHVFFTDSDLQFDLAELPLLIDRTDDAPVVIGYRQKRQDSVVRILNAHVWNIANRTLFGLRVHDIDGAFKLFRRDALKRVELHSEGAMVSAELLLKLHRAGITIAEVPVSHFPRARGTQTGARVSVILRALRELWRLYSVEMGDTIQIQFIKFSAIGIINMLVTIIVYSILTRAIFSPSAALYAEPFAYLAGALVSFIANRRWTFFPLTRGRETNVGEFLRFYATVAGAIAFNLALVAALTALGANDIASVIIAGFCTVLWNFLLFKYWVFRPQTFGVHTND